MHNILVKFYLSIVYTHWSIARRESMHAQVEHAEKP